MKLVCLTNYFHKKSGGIRTFYMSVLRHASGLGHQATVIVPGSEPGIERVGGGKIIYLGPLFPQSSKDEGYRLILPHRYLFFGLNRLWSILDSEKPDVVEISDKYSLPLLGGLLSAGLHGLGRSPAVAGFSHERMDDNVEAYAVGGMPGNVFSRFYLASLYVPMFDYFIANSRYTAAELAPLVKDRGQPLEICPMGIDFGWAGRRKKPARSRLKKMLASRAGVPEDAGFLLYVGRLAPEKNLSLAVETLANLNALSPKKYFLVLAGEGPSQKPLAGLARQLGVSNLVFAGHIGDREELAEYYSSADAFLHPNPREPFGIAPLEAMAFRLPLVAPGAGGVMAYASGRNAWLAKADPQSFSKAVIQACRAGSARSKKIAEAHKTARAYDWDRVIAGYFGLHQRMFKKVLGRRLA